MSKRVLHIDSSIFVSNGVSHQLGQKLIAGLRAVLPNIDVTHRDLGIDSIPHFTAQTMADIGEGKAELADQLIAELQTADILVLGAPMYNFTIPSVLKAWFDHVARAGTTFEYTDSGPVGLLRDKKVIVLTSRGGIHRDGPSDHVVPYLTTILGFLGLTDIDYIYAEGLNMSGGAREAAVSAAEHHVNTVVQALGQREEGV